MSRPTRHALLELAEEITSSLDNKKYSVGIFIDLKLIMIYSLQNYISMVYVALHTNGY